MSKALQHQGAARTGCAAPDVVTATGLQNQPVACAHHTSPTLADGGREGAGAGAAGAESVGPNICPLAGRSSEASRSSSASGSAEDAQRSCRQARMARLPGSWAAAPRGGFLEGRRAGFTLTCKQGNKNGVGEELKAVITAGRLLA